MQGVFFFFFFFKFRVGEDGEELPYLKTLNDLNFTMLFSEPLSLQKVRPHQARCIAGASAQPKLA